MAVSHRELVSQACKHASMPTAYRQVNISGLYLAMIHDGMLVKYIFVPLEWCGTCMARQHRTCGRMLWLQRVQTEI